MGKLKGFIEVTAQYDKKPLIIRADLIESVADNAEFSDGETVHFACRTIYYAGRSVNVVDNYEDIINAMYLAEL